MLKQIFIAAALATVISASGGTMPTTICIDPISEAVVKYLEIDGDDNKEISCKEFGIFAEQKLKIPFGSAESFCTENKDKFDFINEQCNFEKDGKIGYTEFTVFGLLCIWLIILVFGIFKNALSSK